jgi:sec-independent protein translocase protein TatA
MPLSMMHLVIVLLVVALVFGTSKLKGVGKDLGGAIKDFKDSMNDKGTPPPASPSTEKKTVE